MAMINEHPVNPNLNELKCEVCNARISYPDALKIKDLDYLVCQSFDCQRLMRQKSSLSPSLFQTQLEFQRKLHFNRQRKEDARKKIIEEAKLKQDQENQKILENVLNNNSKLSRINTHIVKIPSGLSTLDTPLPERIKLYKAHIIKIIKQAIRQNENSETEIDAREDVHDILIKVENKFIKNPRLRTISDRLCSLCKGGCCTSGKEHAYLSAISIKRYMNLNLELSAADILERYLSYISSETVVGACINQTKAGCALPKELRSDTCNGHYCDSLKSYQQKLVDEKEIGTVLAIQRAGTCWNSCGPQVGAEIVNIALIEEGGIQLQDLSTVTK